MNVRDRRALLAGGFVVGVAVLALRAAPWAWTAAHQSRDALESRIELLVRMRADVAGASRLQDSAAVVRQRMAAFAAALVSAGDSSQAAATLGALVTVAAERHHVRVSRTDALTDSTRAGPARGVSVRASLESDTAGLVGMLQALSSGPEVVVVQELAASTADPQVVASRPEILHTELTVQGWYLPHGATQ